MAQLDLLPTWLLAKSASGGFSDGLCQRQNRQIFKSGLTYALERLRAARGKELGQAVGWEACSNMRKARSTGARFQQLRQVANAERTLVTYREKESPAS